MVFVAPPKPAATGSAAASSSTGAGQTTPSLPNPVLRVVGQFGAPENNVFQLSIDNRDAYAELFRPAPELPPCGTNANAWRTWLDIYAESGTRLNGFV